MPTLLLAGLFALALLRPAAAAAQAAQPASVAPTRIPVSGVLRGGDGQLRTGPVLLVISLYERQDDTAPRWIEHQNIVLDALGRYEVQFGATRDEGLPADLFAGDAATRWLGVAVDGEPEQPRVMLVSVPYAAKAASADALSGKTLDDFVLSSTLQDDVRTLLQDEGVTPSAIAGTLNFIQKGDGAAGTLDSNIYETSGRVGIGTAAPFSRLHILDTTESEFRLQINGGALAVIRGVVGAADFGTFSGHPVRFFSGSSERIRIAANGDVGIGTEVPNAKLHVNGSATVTGNLNVDGNIAAKYQDVAEWVPASEPLSAGTIVVIDPQASNHVRASVKSYDSRVAGAVSPQPGLVLGEPGEAKVLIAQSGRVRIKVDAKYGAIKPGDLLVSSPTKGHAMRVAPGKVRPGTMIGKALEALPSGQGEVLALLTLQ